jgi:hypothetical protein
MCNNPTLLLKLIYTIIWNIFGGVIIWNILKYEPSLHHHTTE